MEQVIVVTDPSPWNTATLRGLVEICREDRRVNGRSPLHPATQAMAVHRLGEWAEDPARGLLERTLGRAVHRAARAFVRNTIGYEISTGTRLGRRVHFAHQHGIVIAPETVIGDDTLIHHDVTIGLRGDITGKPPKVGARIGARVNIGPGARILGVVRIGDDAVIGPNAVVMTDVPAQASVIAAPSRVLRLRTVAEDPAS